MAVSFRPNRLISHIITFLSCLLLLLAQVNDALASPVTIALEVRSPGAGMDPEAYHWKRVTPIIKTSDVGNNTAVFNPNTNEVIPQGPGTDGGGVDFALPAIIWLAFVFIVGIPLALAGIRLWRVTTGLAIGLAVTLGVWAAFVNTVNAQGLSDIALTVLSMGGFVIGFVVGVLNIGRWAGILLIGILGGFSVGIRVVLLRPGLLIPNYVVNWLVLVPFLLVGLAGLLIKQRFGIVSCSAAIGTFLVGLGVDLIVQRQAGISFALRFLFDRNNSHFLDIVNRGYNPSLMTQINLGVSIGLIPFLAYGQHKIFKGPFHRKKPEFEDAASILGTDPNASMAELKPTPRVSRMQLMRSRFSLT